jgi:hypothetical protein
MPKAPLLTFRISHMDALVLLMAIQRAHEFHELSNLDSERTTEELYKAMNKTFPINKKLLESALAYANFLNEKKQFTHPKKMSFKTFLNWMFRGSDFEFDLKYNLLVPKKEK